MLALHLCQLVCVISYWIRRVKRKKVARWECHLTFVVYTIYNVVAAKIVLRGMLND